MAKHLRASLVAWLVPVLGLSLPGCGSRRGAVPLQDPFQANGYFTARVGKVYHSRFEEEFRWALVVDPYDAVPEEGGGAVWGPSTRKDEEEPDGRAARQTAQLLAARRDQP